jgi:hypothetical protein
MTKKFSPISPTLIGWVDYLDFWAESNLSKLKHLDFLDFYEINLKIAHRSSGPADENFSPFP